MNNVVTEDQRAFYAQNGYLVVEEFLDAGELEEWRQAVDHAVAERGRQRFATPSPEQATSRAEQATPSPEQATSRAEQATPSPEQADRRTEQATPSPDQADRRTEEDRTAAADGDDEQTSYYDRVFTQRVNLWQTDDHMKKLLFDPELAKLPGRLAGVDGLRIWADQALIKEPYANPTGFHLDVPYWSFSSPDAITIWLALDDATLENGCLYYVPGSHLAKKFDNVTIGPELGALFKVYPEWAAIAPVPCPVPAGGALLHNGLMAHGAGANLTPGRRRAMTCIYMPDGSRFNGIQNVLPPDYFHSLRVGDLLDNDGLNPVVYRREDS